MNIKRKYGVKRDPITNKLIVVELETQTVLPPVVTTNNRKSITKPKKIEIPEKERKKSSVFVLSELKQCIKKDLNLKCANCNIKINHLITKYYKQDIENYTRFILVVSKFFDIDKQKLKDLFNIEAMSSTSLGNFVNIILKFRNEQ
jgi:hypothetical protein